MATLAGVLAAAVFLLSYAIAGLGFFPALAISGGVYLGLAVTAVLRDRRRARQSNTEGTLESTLRAGARKLATLKRAADGITEQRVRAQAYGVCDAVARMLSDVRDDPGDLGPARKFFGYYLDATIRVVERYHSLSRRRDDAESVREALTRAEQSLETIRRAYDAQLAHLLENDVMNLDVEIDVLEKTIRMEGLGST